MRRLLLVFPLLLAAPAWARAGAASSRGKTSRSRRMRSLGRDECKELLRARPGLQLEGHLRGGANSVSEDLLGESSREADALAQRRSHNGSGQAIDQVAPTSVATTLQRSLPAASRKRRIGSSTGSRLSRKVEW